MTKAVKNIINQKERKLKLENFYNETVENNLFSLMYVPVLARRQSHFLFENPVEMSYVIEPHLKANVAHGAIAALQDLHRFADTQVVNILYKGSACDLLENM